MNSILLEADEMSVSMHVHVRKGFVRRFAEPHDIGLSGATHNALLRGQNVATQLRRQEEPPQLHKYIGESILLCILMVIPDAHF